MIRRLLLGMLLLPIFGAGMLCSMAYLATGHQFMAEMGIICGLGCLGLTALLSRD